MANRMKKYRDTFKADSNNETNPNKNICNLAVCRALKVDHLVRYLHTPADAKRAISKKYALRSRKTALKARTVHDCIRNAKNDDARAYFVWIEGHVLLLTSDGTVAVDTAPKYTSENPKVHGVWGIYRKDDFPKRSKRIYW